MRVRNITIKKAVCSMIATMLCFFILSCSLEYKEDKSNKVRLRLSSIYTTSDEYTEPTYFKVQLIGEDNIIMRTLYTNDPYATLTFSNIPKSKYSVRVYGYNSESMDSILGYGDTSFSVEDNKTALVETALTTESSLDGKVQYGNVEVLMKWESAFQIDEIKVLDEDGKEVSTQSTSSVEDRGDGYKTILLKSKVPAGKDRKLSFVFISDGKVIGTSESDTFTIYAGQSSNSEKNTEDANDPYKHILQPVDFTIDVSFDMIPTLSWSTVAYADTYEIWRVEGENKTLIDSTKETTFEDRSNLPNGKISYFVKAVNSYSKLSSESNSISLTAKTDAFISIILPKAPDEVNVIMNGLTEANYTLTSGGVLTINAEEVEGIASYNWYLNKSLISTEKIVEIKSDHINLSTSTENGIQTLTLVLVDNQGRSYSATALFTYKENTN